MRENVLLIEPGYKNKYPPLGLMKIAYFHRKLHNDYVYFAKGELPENFAPRKWHRIYVTSLFTFEYDNTVKAIKYAQSLADKDTIIVVGGIAATLMPNLYEEATGIKPITGMLNVPGKLGLAHDECIDILPLDYSILDQIDYKYPAHDAYFLSATKGCGMRCGFCAVQKLEPTYIPYLDIKEKVKRTNEEFGEKRDLLLMDNNVLISKNFDQIIDDILELGFHRGATFTNPKTGKTVQRYVDFNQGLDAKLINEHKAKRLGEIALSPARIAFDHIEDEYDYVHAIELCCKYGVTELSNYLLYNSENFSGKGSQYAADTPENLYERMRISLDLQNRLNLGLPKGHERISIFSFPMRYIPLDATKRGYIGSCWNAKFLRSVQCMLIPTQGKGVGKQSFFEADFGSSSQEFVKNLCMPEKLLSARGHFVEQKDDTNREERYLLWEKKHLLIKMWNSLFDQLGEEKDDFITLIGDNEYLPEKVLAISSPLQQRLYTLYLTDPRLFKLLGMCTPDSDTWNNLHEFFTESFPLMYNQIINYLLTNKTQQTYLISSFCHFFGSKGIKGLLSNISNNNISDMDSLLKVWSRGAKEYFNFDLLRLLVRYCELNCLTENETKEAFEAVHTLNSFSLSRILQSKFQYFSDCISKELEGESGQNILNEASKVIMKEIQISFFE